MTSEKKLPRRGDYAVVEDSLGPRRDFRIAVGLREGWDEEGRVFDRARGGANRARLDEAAA